MWKPHESTVFLRWFGTLVNLKKSLQYREKEEHVSSCQGFFFQKIVNPFFQTIGDQKILKAGNSVSTGSLLRLSEV